MILYWIDDNHKTKARQAPEGASKTHLEKKLGVTLMVSLVATHADFESVAASMQENQTYGVFMDYQLLKVGTNNSTEYGTTWAAHLRSIKPSIPVVGLSSEKESSIPKFRIANFLAFFKRGDLIGVNPPTGQMRALFEGYRVVWRKWKKLPNSPGIELIMNLLGAPDAAAELLRVAIPSSMRLKWDEESPHSVTRWIWHDLQGRPGFLLDELEAATYLGITKAAFAQFQSTKHFEEARYRGALACDERTRWWAALMRGAVERIIGKRVIGPAAHSRNELLVALDVAPKKRAAMLASARRRVGQIPECVAYPDQDSKNAGYTEKRIPAMLRDTIVDEIDANPPLGFQAPRHFQFNAAS